MAHTRLSPGDLERLAELESQRIAQTAEYLLQRFLPGIFDLAHECDTCGALVMDMPKHNRWHLALLAGLRVD